MTKHESEFDLEHYEEFYEDHQFTPLSEKGAVEAHLYMPRVGWALDTARSTTSRSVLDLGCLDGFNLLTLAKQYGCSGLGIDLSKRGIDIATQRAKKHGLAVNFKQGKCEDEMEKLIKAGTKYDLITCFEVIEHVEDIDYWREAMDKLVAPGGSILISTPSFEGPTFGMDDEKNKCHIRLFTQGPEDYEAVNKYGNTRKATSITKWLGAGDAEKGKERILNMNIWGELIHVRYK
jgi:2-polyprenyl-3-methyl-5-hydroxy-6-metoxy-1,4-benzoquinol methylase